MCIHLNLMIFTKIIRGFISAQHGTMRFIEYVRWVRMAKARMILQKYHLSIHEVAQRCGFPDSDYFCRVFRRQFGLTPGEYSARFQG